VIGYVRDGAGLAFEILRAPNAGTSTTAACWRSAQPAADRMIMPARAPAYFALDKFVFDPA
jgi:hypothetical protein